MPITILYAVVFYFWRLQPKIIKYCNIIYIYIFIYIILELRVIQYSLLENKASKSAKWIQ